MGSDINRWCLTVCVGLVVLKALYLAIGVACKELNDSKLKDLSESDSKYLRLTKLLSKGDRLWDTLSMWDTLCTMGIVVSIVGSRVYSTWVYVETVRLLGGRTECAKWLSGIVCVLLGVVLLEVFTVIVPKRLAEEYPNLVARFGTLWLTVLMAILSPITLAIQGLAFVVSKAFRLSTSRGDGVVTEEEILKMVETGNETGVIEESQKDMINNIFEFEDVTIYDVMTHRKDIIAVDVDSKISELVYIANNEGVSRIPVYQKNVDNIIGVIYVKDLLSLVGCKDSEKFNVAQFMRKVMYVHEYCKCSELFESMTKKKVQMAIVVDEYGGTAGLITLEDLIEEIVGNIQDEYDEEDKEIEEISEGVYTIDGSTDVEDVCPVLGITLPEEHNYDTMSAFIVDLLGHIPAEDELAMVEYQGVTFTVLLVEDNWVSKIKAIVKVES